MSSSTTNLDLISSSQAAKEVTANALFDAESPAALYGRRASTTANLTWGYYGGYLSITGVPTAVSNGTLTLTANSTNYVVANQSTGNVSVSTSTTNWNDTAGFIRLYSIVAGASTVTSYVDYRTQYHTNGLALGVDAGNALRVDQAPQAWVRLATTALGNTAVNGTLSATGNTVSVFTGTANVTYHVRCLGNGTIVHNASVTNIVQGAANISTNAGDTFDVEMLTANTCNVKNYVSTRGGPVSNADVSLLVTVASANTVDIFGAAGATIDLTGNVIVTGIVACTAAQVGSSKTVIPSGANGTSFTASANMIVDGATSGTFLMPHDAIIEVLATSTTTFVVRTVFATGSWTPAYALTTPGTSSFGNYAVQVGTFTKIGNKVTLLGNLTGGIFSVGTGSGALTITGFPFTINSSVYGGAFITFSNAYVTLGPTHARAVAGSTSIRLSNASGATMTDLAAANCANALRTDFVAEYFV